MFTVDEKLKEVGASGRSARAALCLESIQQLPCCSSIHKSESIVYPSGFLVIKSQLLIPLQKLALPPSPNRLLLWKLHVLQCISNISASCHWLLMEEIPSLVGFKPCLVERKGAKLSDCFLMKSAWRAGDYCWDVVQPFSAISSPTCQGVFISLLFYK